MFTVDPKYVRTASDREAVKLGCYIDVEAANKVYNFFRGYLRHTKDEWAGRPFVLLDWEWRDLVFPLYAWRMPDGSRRFKQVKCGIPKKNGKSTLTAGIAIHEGVRGNTGGHICLTAGEKEQAKIIFNEAVSMLRRAPKPLRKLAKIRESYNLIKFPKRDSIIVPLSADAPKREGINPSVIVMDELHTQPDRSLWNALRYSMSARKESLFMWLSTAGEYDETSLWMEEFEKARKVIRGELVDIEILAVMYEATKDDDWKEEATWRKANPSYGITLPPEKFKKDCEDAQVNGAEESIFKRYRLNIPTPPSATWIRYDIWENCKFQFDFDDFRDILKRCRIYAGLDLSLALDLTAFTILAIDPTTELHYFFPYFWLPKAKLENRKNDLRNNERYRIWNELGFLKLTARLPVVDYDEVAADIGQFIRQWGIEEVCIDKWNESRIAHLLRDSLRAQEIQCGISVISAGTMNMSKATKEFERLILADKLRHTNHPVMNWCFQNCRVVTDHHGNQFVSKKESPDKIDGVYAGLVALAVDIDNQVKELKKKSRYENPNADVLRFRRRSV